MPAEVSSDVQRKQFDRAVKSLRDLGPTIIDAASYAEESYLASDRPDLELANAREYIVSTLASVAGSLTQAAGRLSANVQREGEEALADTELLVAAYSQKLQALSISCALDHSDGIRMEHAKVEEGASTAQPETADQQSEGDSVTGEKDKESMEKRQGTGNPPRKSTTNRGRRGNAPQASIQDSLDRLAGLTPQKPQLPPKETSTSPKGTTSATDQPPTPLSLPQSEAMFDSPPWDWKPIDNVYTAHGSPEMEMLSALGTPSTDGRRWPAAASNAGSRGLPLRHGMSPKVPGTREENESGEESLRLFRPPLTSVPKSDTGETSYADWEELEVRSQLTDDYYRGPYDDGPKTPEAEPLVSGRRPGNGGGMLGSSTPGSSTTPQRTRKRDILKRAISKFKLHGHEQSIGPAEAHLEHL